MVTPQFLCTLLNMEFLPLLIFVNFASEENGEIQVT